MELDDYLDSLRNEGQADSSGTFTLDLEKAMEKLREWRFATPESYILNLVAAAVASGSPSLEAQVSRDQLSLVHRGRLVDRTELAELFSRLFAPRRDRYLEELAIGLFGATRAHTGPLVLETFDPEGKNNWRLTLTATCLQVEAHGKMWRNSITRAPVSSSLTRIQIPCGWGAKAELALLRERCRECGIPILMEVPFQLPVLRSGSLVLTLKSPTPTSWNQPFATTLQLTGSSGEEFSLRLQYHAELQPGPPTFVRLGVSYSETVPELTGLADRVWVFTDQLRLDLSQGGLVRDGAYVELVERAERAAWRGLASLVEGPDMEALQPELQELLRCRLLTALAQRDRRQLTTRGVPWEPILKASWLPLATGGMTSPLYLFECYRQGRFQYVAETPYRPDEPGGRPVLLQTPRLRAPLKALFPLKQGKDQGIRHAW